ncbi:MAG TPA: sulfatase [Fimbriimonadaceae bacterium]|nr:sulfatase [Fimbriimonadaceae bacterium]
MKRALLGLCLVGLAAGALAQRPPNVIVIFADDLGWGDLSCYGQTHYKTPFLDKMAEQGMRFTDFYVASPGCSPSRAALLTGCYPQRVSVPQVLNPDSKTGLNPDETTIAEMLRARGYATAMVGKWHLGVTPPLMPLAQGFDEYYGLPYSNDMWPMNGKQWPPLFLYEGNTPVEPVKDMATQGLLTRKYTERALDFIRRHREKPFFLYFAHSMTHVPINASPSFLGKSGAGLYGDTTVELDWSVGRIMEEVTRLGLDKDTLIVFTSDNGPWLPYGDWAGSSGGLREGKGTTFEGGMREPGIFWWPGHIPAGRVCHEVATTMDLLPTIAAYTGAALPSKEIDGHDITDLLKGTPGAKSPTDAFFYYWPGELQAVRAGRWKLHVPHKHRHQEGLPGKDGKRAGEVTAEIGLSLFDLITDPDETDNVAAEHPDIVVRLLKLIEEERKKLGDTGTKTKGDEVRPPGRVVGSGL